MQAAGARVRAALPSACAAKSSAATPPSGVNVYPAHTCCCQAGSIAISFAYTFTKPSVFTPKTTPLSGEHRTRPMSRDPTCKAPPRRCANAIITSGRNHNHRPAPVSASAVARVPAASIINETTAGTSSRRTRGLWSPGYTHSFRHSSPYTRKSFAPSRSMVYVSEMTSSDTLIVGTSTPASTLVRPI